LDLQYLRSQVGLVLQEPFLFPMTIADNIAYGKPRASMTDIKAAARAANAHEFIQRLPQGYQTQVGEGRGALSGGERQRISIARALLKNAPVLILDEPTSALDVDTERDLLQAWKTLTKDRTTLLIAHRFSTIRSADLIVVLNIGQIAEQGKHEELMALNGLYRRLHDRQSGASSAAPK
jgi:ATP-binding cassette subfamily B protein/subfamily B ATP-binding cassette protein MsbA